ncbi:hypothetical protein [Photobacterium kishitanii]|uniref:Uncharacterized protein n=1 Tax=Photobacterium kishitanii TaxID=318456 RepID=A0A2T3KLP8_9GAMM|nr:hypothetical protein [Photobacterium kishitanii]PSV00567.1 hypothetical protein C9J27_05375 [Photobacterium kishitanii]
MNYRQNEFQKLVCKYAAKKLLHIPFYSVHDADKTIICVYGVSGVFSFERKPSQSHTLQSAQESFDLFIKDLSKNIDLKNDEHATAAYLTAKISRQLRANRVGMIFTESSEIVRNTHIEKIIKNRSDIAEYYTNEVIRAKKSSSGYIKPAIRNLLLQNIFEYVNFILPSAEIYSRAIEKSTSKGSLNQDDIINFISKNQINNQNKKEKESMPSTKQQERTVIEKQHKFQLNNIKNRDIHPAIENLFRMKRHEVIRELKTLPHVELKALIENIKAAKSKRYKNDLMSICNLIRESDVDINDVIKAL